jgi:mono/diheme cytochrome c family protein
MRGQVMLNQEIKVVACVAFFAAMTTSSFAQDQQAAVARGRYLVTGPAACGNCHTPVNADRSPRTDMFLAGGQRFDSPVFTAYSRNLTPDKDTGIGAWTDEQVVRAMREGVSREGQTLGPPMPVPVYHNMADDDARAIVAFLRTVKPVRNEVPESQFKIPLKSLPAVKGIVAPAKTDKVVYGGYIVNAIAHCFECHTPAGEGGAPGAMGSGGRPFALGPGIVVRSRNITSDKETGLGAWTDDEIKRAITTGVDKNGMRLSPPMAFAYFKNMTPDDLDAVVAYVRTIPPVSNRVERAPPPPAK